MSNVVRLGLIGCGGMAQAHISYVKEVEGLELTACADPVEANRNKVAEDYKVKAFADGIELLDSGLVDAVLVGTPHYFHPTYAIAAFERGIHVLTDKPVAVTAKAAQEMNDAADKNPKLVYAAMFQLRTMAIWKEAKRLIDNGEVGEITRANWNITTWFRTQAYYDSGGWRATWKGEGGGVLLNQCPHNLDLLQWLAGMPKKLWSIVGISKHHNIEVEDDVTAMFEFENGAVGTFVTTTGEAPGVNRFEIVGDNATMIIEPADGKITLLRSEEPVQQAIKTSKERMAVPGHIRYEITPKDASFPSSAPILRNFTNAILHGEELIAPGREGIHGLELGNAMLMSGLKQQPVELPMDRDAYDQLINDLIEEAEAKKAVTASA